MIVGAVTDDGVPTITLRIAGEIWNAVIDSGFNGDLELPEQIRPYVNARFLFRISSLLAAGLAVAEDLYLVEFPFDGRMLQLEATFVEN